MKILRRTNVQHDLLNKGVHLKHFLLYVRKIAGKSSSAGAALALQ